MWIKNWRRLRRCSPSKPHRTRHDGASRLRASLFALLFLILAEPVFAEILSRNSPFMRIRLGDNVTGGTNTVVYDAQIPASMGGLTGVTASPETVSNTVIGGGNNPFRVRIVTDVNARSGLTFLQGTFAWDSSQPMQCVTPATCGTTDIAFTRIRWNTQDSDTHVAVTSYDGSANQVAQVQTDTNPATNGTNNRHRNHFQYIFDNAELLPAGTYEGTVTLNGTGTF